MIQKSIRFPRELEEKVKIVMERYHNDFNGAVLWMVSEWIRDHELTFQDWERERKGNMTAESENENVHIIADAIKKGQKVMVRESPGGKLIPIEEYLGAKEDRSKEAK